MESLRVYLLRVWQPKEAGITEMRFFFFLLKTKQNSPKQNKQQQPNQQSGWHIQITITQLLKQAILPFSVSSKSRGLLKTKMSTPMFAETSANQGLPAPII